MGKHDSIKKTLLSSVLSVVLCISMLFGTTYAWFSEKISNNGNHIQTSTLEADLLMYNQEEGKYVPVEGQNLFVDYTGNPIEPGEIQVVYLKVKNSGKSALNYNVKVGIFESESKDDANETVDNVNSEDGNAEVTDNVAEPISNTNPASMLEYAVIQGVDNTTGLTGTWTEITTKAKEAAGEKASGAVPVEAPVEVFANKVNLTAATGDTESEQYFVLAICIPEGASMDYQGITVENLGVQVVAEQVGVVTASVENVATDSESKTEETD